LTAKPTSRSVCRSRICTKPIGKGVSRMTKGLAYIGVVGVVAGFLFTTCVGSGWTMELMTQEQLSMVNGRCPDAKCLLYSPGEGDKCYPKDCEQRATPNGCPGTYSHYALRAFPGLYTCQPYEGSACTPQPYGQRYCVRWWGGFSGAFCNAGLDCGSGTECSVKVAKDCSKVVSQ